MKIVHELIETPNLYSSSDKTSSAMEELSSAMEELSSTNSSVTSSSIDEDHADLLLFPLLHNNWPKETSN